jgi:hypothetical protein
MKCNSFARLVIAGILALAAVVIPIMSFADQASDSAKTQEAYQKLFSCHIFAFGGTGFAGTISAEEKAFHTIAASGNGAEVFSKLLEKGTSEAQMYALCGIRKLTPDKLTAASNSFRPADAAVSTMSGCILSKLYTSNVVKLITGGSYDLHMACVR